MGWKEDLAALYSGIPGPAVTAATAPLVLAGGVVSLPASSPTNDGYMTAAQAEALESATGGGVTSVTGSAPIVSSGGATPEISISAASGAAAGSMSAAHYSLVNGATSAATASTVVKRDAAGRFQAVAGVAADDVAVVSQLGGTSWRVAPDAHDLGVWTMEEASGNFANTGADGALDLVPSAGWSEVHYARSGQLVTCVSPPSLDAYIASADSPSGCQPAGALTVWSWILLTQEPPRYAMAIGKLHAASGWTGPYLDYALDVMPTGNYGHWRAHINIGGAVDGLRTLELGGTSGTSTHNGSTFTIGVPHLLGLTHDGTTLRAYFDGALAGSMSAVGSIGYGAGPIVRSGITPATGAGGYGLYGLLGEARVADTVRSAAYFAEVYQRFMRRWP